MRFWHKSYLCVLIIFLVAFDIGAYVLLQTSYRINETMDIERAVNEFNGTDQALHYILQTYTSNTGSGDIEPVIASFADNYRRNGVFLEVFDGDRLIFSNTSLLSIERVELTDNTLRSVYRKVDGSLLLYTGGPMTFQNLRMVISRNSDYLLDFYNEILQRFVNLSMIVSGVLSVVLIFILLYLTAPIRKLHEAVSLFAAGNYDKRAVIRGHDEIHELAANFNHMADTVQHNIEELQKESELKEILINNLTHELKTPITAIKGYSEFLKNANYSEADRRMALNYIIEHVSRLDTLSLKLVDLLYAQNSRLTPAEVDIEGMFSQVSRFVNHQIKAKPVTLHIRCTEKKMWGDQDLLTSLLVNLVENSIKAVGENGWIALSSYLQNNHVVLEVEDNGIGIPEEDIARITEAFYVVDQSRSRTMGGLGLGLSLCSQIISLHQAKMHIESKLHSGTKISIFFTTS